MEPNMTNDSPPVSQNSDNLPETKLEVVRRKILPYSAWLPILLGALFGVILRLVFSGAKDMWFSAMSGAFIYLVPLAVGVITVYVAETSIRRSWPYYIFAPAAANVLFVLGTMAILIEGLICAVIIIPLFAIIGAVGGLVMGVICRATNWPKHAVVSFAALPLLFAVALPQTDGNNFIGHAERKIIVQTDPASIWRQLHKVEYIQPGEVSRAWMYRIGVPLPLTGVTETTPNGLLRKITMGKSIHFDQVSTEWETNRRVKWTYKFYENSFPPHALDDHVMIGGRYFDIIDTEYVLTPITSQTTELTIRMQYRVSTQFNWYANSVAQLLIGNFEEVILAFYAKRASGVDANQT